ncbi:hypothetical protein [Thiomonas sp.]
MRFWTKTLIAVLLLLWPALLLPLVGERHLPWVLWLSLGNGVLIGAWAADRRTPKG